MKKIILLVAVFLCLTQGNAQQRTKDSLKTLLKKEKQDTGRVTLLNHLSYAYGNNKPDTAILLAYEALSLSKRIGFVKGEAGSLNMLAIVYNHSGNGAKALENYLQAQKLYEKINDSYGISGVLNNIGNTYRQQGEYRQAIGYFIKSMSLSEKLKSKEGLAVNLGNLSTCYFGLKQYDSALVYVRQAYAIASKFNYPARTGFCLKLMGDIYSETGQKKLALQYYRLSIPFSRLSQSNLGISDTFIGMAKLFENDGRADSALLYANQAFEISRRVGKFNPQIQNASNFLYSFYKKRRIIDSALYYLEIATTAKDSTFSQQKINKFHSLDIEEKMRQQEIIKQQEQYNNRLKMYGLLAVVVVFLVIAVILWRNNRLKQKANEKIQSTLAELRLTQSQLIQSEKMASLGELTAGIAHEIQNPLNFVNNFSEVNKEMLEELKAESKKLKAERDEQLEIELINDLIENESKINHHGKRADAIVKGMLQHSQSSSGKKEPTDLNALVDEYLRLSYHGLRAKDKEFNSELVTHFDENLPKVNVIPQDIGRVLLNLFNNAFYAVNQKSKTAGDDYKPEVSVSTSTDNGQVIIKVKDNGTGIPDAVKEKIMQPFFTTKPTGEGTGLGLSLTYDMVVKGHGGTIEVDSKEGEGSTFKISLPV
jgi:two-component system NtrC family sensor kinase